MEETRLSLPRHCAKYEREFTHNSRNKQKVTRHSALNQHTVFSRYPDAKIDIIRCKILSGKNTEELSLNTIPTSVPILSRSYQDNMTCSMEVMRYLTRLQ